MFVTTEEEKEVLQKAMQECRRRMEYARSNDDELAADLAEADLNQMLDKWRELDARTDTTAA